jgi:hypothetical protein
VKTRILLIALCVAGLVLTWSIYLRVAQARRDSAYRAAIAPFERDLHVGMRKADVEQYLDSRHAQYYPVASEKDGITYEIKIGEEDGLICEWAVYVAVEFGSTDTLKLVHIKKEGTCL